MQKLTNQVKWKPWQGVLCEVLFIIMLITAGAYMQGNWGMMGLLGTEIMFLITAIIITKLHKTPLKEVFPVAKISVKDFFGILFFSIGAILFNFICLGISACIFPNELKEAAALSEFMNEGLPFVVFFLIVAVSPAICEESIMRGVLLSHFRGLKRDWVIALIVGCSFGILHLSFLRFLSTAFIGTLMAYLMTKRNNIIFPCLLHFFNNSLSAIVSQFNTVDPAQSAAALESVNTIQLLGTYMLIGFLAPVFVVLGAYMLNLKKIKWPVWLVASILSVSFLGFGMISLVLTSFNREVVTNSTFVCAMSEETPLYMHQISVEKEGNYQVAIVATVPSGEVTYTFVNPETGDVAFQGSGSTIIVSSQFVDLVPGDYEFYIEGDSDTYDSSVTVAVEIVSNEIK